MGAKKIAGYLACLLAGLTLPACGGSPEAKAPPTAAATSAPASPSPSPDPGTMKFGQTFTFPEDRYATVTVYGYKHNATKFGSTDDDGTVYGALDIKYCLKRLPAGTGSIELSGYPWTLKFGNSAFQSTGSSGGAAMNPEYPEGRRIKVGSCIRGWLDFEVPKTGRLTEVQYAPQADGVDIISWRPE
ncbi:hypothetical protein KBX37_31145 [Micromonospora sp. U56]|uniref:hypothetical protein n=1 Tax=Micromonospora sp. U56 TaxID=2824900 RepID=UPI001B35BC04|nr:hypothetical protein [Micromonospora sp. U56]MBQ0897468.1 hypothetical protein [Micromonospora sp. U56]